MNKQWVLCGIDQSRCITLGKYLSSDNGYCYSFMLIHKEFWYLMLTTWLMVIYIDHPFKPLLRHIEFHFKLDVELIISYQMKKIYPHDFIKIYIHDSNYELDFEVTMMHRAIWSFIEILNIVRFLWAYVKLCAWIRFFVKGLFDVDGEEKLALQGNHSYAKI